MKNQIITADECERKCTLIPLKGLQKNSSHILYIMTDSMMRSMIDCK